ncbi:MAG: hypothetical protein V4642_09650 [Bacteroidota bacterium]
MKTILTALACVFSLSLITGVSYAQLPGNVPPVSPKDTLFQVETTDGNTFLGYITFQDSLMIRLETEKLGELTINRKDIAKITEINSEKIVEGKYWSDNPQSTRYMWAPNGFGMKKGEGYYQNIWVMFNQVSGAFTDNLSVGVGVIPSFLFGADVVPFWITPKVSIPIRDNINIGVGALAFNVIGVDDMSWTGLLYSTATFGTPDKNLSVGLGYGFVDGELASTPTVNISGLIRGGEKWYFMMENYYLSTDPFEDDDNGVLITGIGGRRMLGKASIDFGIVRGHNWTFIGMPWLGFTIPFGS